MAARTPKTIDIIAATRDLRAFAHAVGVSEQAVRKVVDLRQTGEMPAEHYRVVRAPNGKQSYRFLPGAEDWWRSNRGEANNASGHGGRRPGGGRPATKQSSKRKAESGNQEGEEGAEGGDGGDGGEAWDQGLGANGKIGGLTLANIRDPRTGEPDWKRASLLSPGGMKMLQAFEQTRGRRQDRLVRAGELLERSAVVREWTRRTEMIRGELESLPTRAASKITHTLSLGPEQAGIVRELLVEVVAHVRLRIAGKADEAGGEDAGERR